MANTINVDMVVEAITKGFDKVIDQYDDLAKQSKKNAEQNEKTAMSFTEMNQAIELGNKVIESFKQGYDFAREGAEVQALEGKFNNLAISIGGTSDALLNDLRAATGGMISDAQLMAGASDLIELGLAKTQDETILMSELVGKLGLDLQVLGLTIANQSTARLDSLGLSMETVNASVDAYVSAGYEKSEAFKMSVLDGLQARLALVGDTADTNLGAFMRLEAAAENLTNKFKVLATNALLPAVENAASLTDQLGQMSAQMEKNNTPVTDFFTVLNEAQKAIGGTSGDGIVNRIEEWETKDGQLRTGLEMTNAEMGAWEARMVGVTESIEENVDVTDEATEAAKAWQEQYEFNTAVAKDNTEENERLGVSYQDIIDAEDRRAEAAEAEAQALQLLAEEQAALTAATGDYFTAAVNATDALVVFNEEIGAAVPNQDALNQALYDQIDAAGAGAVELAAFGIATGMMSQEQANAALKTALIQAEIERLGELYAAGSIDVSTMQGALQSFIAEIDNLPEVKTVKFKSDLSEWQVPSGFGEDQAAAGAGSGVPEFATGGIFDSVPRGSKGLAVLHGGEEVLRTDDPRHSMNAGDTGFGGNIAVTIDTGGRQWNSQMVETAAADIGEYLGNG